jgi:murein DD-endopeptidase MepM/ murein hydrolase activator NlpD
MAGAADADASADQSFSAAEPRNGVLLDFGRNPSALAAHPTRHLVLGSLSGEHADACRRGNRMKRRRQRRTTLALLAAASMLGGIFSLTAPNAADAATKVAGVGTVKTGGTPLNMRSAASSGSARIGTLAVGSKVSIVCQLVGEHVNGTVRATRVWDRLTNDSFVSDGYIVRASFKIPVCATSVIVAEPPATTGAWMLPVAARMVSGFRTPARPTHDGVDLGAVRNTPIHAAAAGTVIRVVCNVSTNNCDVDGNSTLSGCGWYAEIQHAGGYVTRYCHMVRRPAVTVGQVVAKGAVIGYVGTSGSSSGPHLHFETHTGNPATKANAVSPIVFMRARGIIIS